MTPLAIWEGFEVRNDLQAEASLYLDILGLGSLEDILDDPGVDSHGALHVLVTMTCMQYAYAQLTLTFNSVTAS